MSTGAAKEEVLGELHTKVAKIMVHALDQLDVAQDKFDEAIADGTAIEDALPIRPDIPPALLSVMTKFLADNKITCNPAEENTTGALADRLSKKRVRKSVGNVVPFEPED